MLFSLYNHFSIQMIAKLHFKFSVDSFSLTYTIYQSDTHNIKNGRNTSIVHSSFYTPQMKLRRKKTRQKSDKTF